MKVQDNNTYREQFDSVAAQYGDIVRRVCFMYSSGDLHFDDLYQEAMINIWNGLKTYRGEARLSTWIYRTTVNTCISWLRSQRRYAGNTSLDEALTVVTGDDEERRENLRQIYDIVSRLKPLDRAIILMWLDECPYEEIAAVSGISVANVATRLHRIKAHIKEMFDN